MRRDKNLLRSLLTICFAVGLITMYTLTASAENTNKAIMADTSVLSANVNTENAAKVYFGLYNYDFYGSYIKENLQPSPWRVISYKTSGVQTTASNSGNAVLLSESGIGECDINPELTDGNAYIGSSLQRTDEEYEDKLTKAEKAAIQKRTLTTGTYDRGELCDGVSGPQVDNATFWPLSSKEASQVDPELRKIVKRDDWFASIWWLRSPGNTNDSMAMVLMDGTVQDEGGLVYMYWNISRPAFMLDLSSVIITSPAVDGKPSEVGKASVREIGTTDTSEWKLTVRDDARGYFYVTPSYPYDNGDIDISYENAIVGENEYISALIKDDMTGEYTHYGRIAKVENAVGTAHINLNEIDMTGKSLYIINEQCNGDYKTDYASSLRKIDLIKFIHFDSNGGTPIEQNSFPTAKGEAMTAPKNVTRSCYLFDGWYNNGVRFDSSTPITQNITLTAKWKENILEHTAVGNCGDYLICTKCGGSFVKPHIYVNGVCNNIQADGTTICGAACTHRGGVATCTERAVCVDCGLEYGHFLHTIDTTKYHSDNINHWYQCSCGMSKVEVEAHDCNENGVCSGCGYATTLKDGYYEITNYPQLVWFVTKAHTKEGVNLNAKLTNDIVANENLITDGVLNLKPGETLDNNSFVKWNVEGAFLYNYSGIFDGQGHTISGLFYYCSSVWCAGFFRAVGQDGVIKNLGIKDSYVHGEAKAGIIAGNLLYGTVENCYSVNCIAKADDKYVGSLVGYGIGDIKNSWTTGLAETTSWRGCILYGSDDSRSHVTNSYYMSDIPCADTFGDCMPASAFENGKVAYLLNGDQQSIVWRQNIGTDPYPQFKGMEVGFDGTNYYNKYDKLEIASYDKQVVIKSDEAYGAITIIFASYGEDNNLIDCKLVTDKSLVKGINTCNAPADFNVTDAKKVIVMICDNTVSLRPLCEAFEKEATQI